MTQKIFRRAAIFILLWAVGTAFAQDGANKRHQLVLTYLKDTAADLSRRCLTSVDSLETWKKQRPALRQQLLYMLGLDPLPTRTALKAQITGTVERPKYRIEKIVFQSLPGLYVTGNFYVPTGSSSPLPTILYVCGHSPHPLGAKFSYQDRAIWFASHGYACLVLDTLEFGEVAGIHHGIHDLNMWNWLSLGYTPVGTEVWNAMRALDYLETRPEVDMKRVGMTGISGGGSVTWFTSAVDDRISVAAPVCSTYTFGSQALHWVASGQCDCIYFHNTYLVDFPIVGALIAPRPLIMCSGRKDPDFPPDGYHEVFQRVKKIYDLYTGGKVEPALVREVDDDVGHTDAPLFSREVRQWMGRWLNHPTGSFDAAAVQAETPETLACLAKLPTDAVNYKIHNLFIPTAPPRDWTSLTKWKERRRALLDRLRDKVFRWFPQEKIPFQTTLLPFDGGWASRYAEYKDVEFTSEPGIRLRAQLLKPKGVLKQTPVLIYAKRAGDSLYFLDLDELLPVLGRYSVLILNPRLTEHPVSAFEYAEIERTASWVGRTAASMQVWDILRAVEWLVNEEKVSSSSISVYGKGDMGILALYAGLFDERIQQVILNDPPASHWSSPALLNVLRVTDIPEIAAAFAPRRIVSLTDLPESFNYTRKLYKLHGQRSGLARAGSLPEALRAWKY
jgi:cephalosporin-C deacetylase-like acetyl esterase